MQDVVGWFLFGITLTSPILVPDHQGEFAIALAVFYGANAVAKSLEN